MIVVLGVICFLLCCGIGIGWFLMNKVTHPRMWSSSDALVCEQESSLIDAYDEKQWEHISISSYDGYVLHGQILPCHDSHRWVVCTHGFSFTRHGSIKYALLFHQLGYNVCIYDLRHHGENERTFVSMGYREREDLLSVVQWLIRTYGSHISVGLHGESLGASTSIMALPLFQEHNIPINFCIADCGYSRLYPLLAYQMRRQHPLVPQFFLHIANMVCSLIYHFSFTEIHPIVDLQDNHIPILYIHGQDDSFTPCSMSEQMYEVTQGKKDLYIVEGAEHAKSYAVDQKAYYRKVEQFTHSISSTDM